jgi:hypothetical protein
VDGEGDVVLRGERSGRVVEEGEHQVGRHRRNIRCNKIKCYITDSYKLSHEYDELAVATKKVRKLVRKLTVDQDIRNCDYDH